MSNRRWWDAAVAAATVMVTVAMAVGLSPSTPLDITLASIALGVFVIAGYLLIARPGLRNNAEWRMPAFVVVSALTLAVGCATEPFYAVLQAIAYPLTWVLTDRKRRAVMGSAVIAIGVMIGFAVFADVTDPTSTWIALVTAIATAGFSFAFAVALGLWISSIIDWGEERARLLAELTAAQGEIEALSRERGASAERERLARDIHDTLAQTLAGLTILAERAGKQLADGREDAAAGTIGTVERLTRDALDEARALVARTASPPADTALGDAVGRLVDRFRAETGLTIDLVLDATDTIARDGQLVVLRCLQESLANVRKHASATRVIVRVITASDGSARLEVEDDGDGFDASARHDGFGLQGMTERLALAGGTFEVSSSPGGGTIVAVDLPSAVGAAAGEVAQAGAEGGPA